VLRFISGLGAGSLLATQATLVSEYSPSRLRALAVAVVTAGYPMGAMMTSVVAGYVIPESGWRGMFWFGGILTLGMAFLAIWQIPESLKYLVNRRPKNALALINKQLKYIGKPTIRTLPRAEFSLNINDKRNLLDNFLLLINPLNRRVTISLWLAFFFSFATLYVMLSWIPQMIENSGHTFDTGRDAFFLFNLGGVIGILFMGLLATRFWLSTILLVMFMGSAVGMVVFALFSVQLGSMMFIIFVIGILLQGGFAGLYAAASKAYTTQIRATGLGWCLGLGRSGAVIGPSLAGYLIAAQFDMPEIFLIFSAPMTIAGIIGFGLKLK
jgi:MFS family permease